MTDWQDYLDRIPPGMRQKVIEGLEAGGIATVAYPRSEALKEIFPYGIFIHIPPYQMLILEAAGIIALFSALGHTFDIDIDLNPFGSPEERKERREGRRDERKEKRAERKEDRQERQDERKDKRQKRREKAKGVFRR